MTGITAERAVNATATPIAAIAEIPDLSQMRIELKLDEVDRGKIQLGQKIKVRVDAIPEKEFLAELDWISPIAAVVWKGMGLTDKQFPARATLKNLDPRLRPGMTGSAEIVIETSPDALLIPARASECKKPAAPAGRQSRTSSASPR